MTDNDITPPRLMALAQLPSDERQAIIVVKGERGYHPFRAFPTPELAQAFVERTNARWGVSPAVAEARMVGSMFGPDVPGAGED